jgi:hypothetical protein
MDGVVEVITGREHRHHLTGRRPIEQVTHGGETLIDGRRSQIARRTLRVL